MVWGTTVTIKDLAACWIVTTIAKSPVPSKRMLHVGMLQACNCSRLSHSSSFLSAEFMILLIKVTKSYDYSLFSFLATSSSFCSLFLPSLSLHWLDPPPSPLPLPLSPHFMQFDKPVSARHLKLVILQGFEHFVSVYSIGSHGTPVQE